MTDEKYCGYTDADLDHWERLPLPSNVLTSSTFGAWLMRRDKNRDKSLGLIERSKIDKAIAEIENIELLAKYSRGDIKQLCLEILRRNIGE